VKEISESSMYDVAERARLKILKENPLQTMLQDVTL
jgi:hypothetical protein